MTMELYKRLIEKRNDSNQLRRFIESTVAELLEKNTDVEHPGMLLGEIQSGKTRAFTGIIALGFDKKYDVTVVLTKGTKALVKQTVLRLKSEFEEFEEEDVLRVFDVMEMPEDLNEYVIEKQKLILVVKKEDDNISRLSRIFFEVYPSLLSKAVLIIDDEADLVSIGYRKTKKEDGEKEINLNVIARQLSDFRNALKKGSDYLQVTATPYSLYLQPENIEIRENTFAPMRPKFTQVLLAHEKYIGSQYYFEESRKEASPAKYLFHSIDEDELKTLSKAHGKILDNVFYSPSILSFRTAIINYVTASCIRIIQAESEKIFNYKSSFIVHTETGKLKHENQALITTRLVEALKVESKLNSSILRDRVYESFQDFQLSLSLTNYFVPSFEKVFEKFKEYVRYITIRKINSDNDVLSLLNFKTGELRLESPLNIFIGGQILDRGITVQNLIGFFYGRNPKRMQQDTVMQHARIFGARTLQDMAVTRLYTTDRIYEAMWKMHESDQALRKAFLEGGSRQDVAFLQKAPDGRIIPCSPNKILLSNTITLRPGGTLPIYGFQTMSKTRIQDQVNKITNIITGLSNGNYEEPFLIPVSVANELIDVIYDTFEDEEKVYGCTRNEFKAVVAYATSQTASKNLHGKLYCFANKRPKNSGRYKENMRGKMFNDVCYDGRTDAKKAKAKAIDVPCLFLSYQNGSKEQDWNGASFYWPVLFVQERLVTSIFTTDSHPGDDIDDDTTDDTGPLNRPIQK
jgi:hypothetical protein